MATKVNRIVPLKFSKSPKDGVNGKTPIMIDGKLQYVENPTATQMENTLKELITEDKLTSYLDENINDLLDDNLNDAILRNEILNDVVRYDDSQNKLYTQHCTAGGLSQAGSVHSPVCELPEYISLSNNTGGIQITRSDIRSKDVIGTLNLDLDALAALNILRFTWKDSGKEDIGVIAQDVQQIVPEVVGEFDDGTLGVDYGRLALLIAIQLIREVISLKKLVINTQQRKENSYD